MNDEERIAQLIVVAAYSNKTESHIKEIEDLVVNKKIGGIIFFQGTAQKQIELTNHYQRLAKVPLLILIDGEYGVGMRLDSVTHLPYAINMGAMRAGADLAYQYGKILAQQCIRMGIHVNLAPVIDINNNPENPVINYRSFGESINTVSTYGVNVIKGMQDQHVIATAKHFPGHGDVFTDSHEDLPVINKSREELENLEFIPFKEAINNGKVKFVLASHLSLPQIELKKKIPATISPQIINGILKTDLNFNGVVITDALNMKGLKRFVDDDEVALKTLSAGNDILCMLDNIPYAINSIKKNMYASQQFQDIIYQKTKKVLQTKYEANLNISTYTDERDPLPELNQWVKTNFMDKVVEKSVSLVKLNQRDLFKKKYSKIVYLAVGETEPNRISYLLKQNNNVDLFLLNDNEYSKRYIRRLLAEYKEYKNDVLFIIGLHKYTNSIKRNFNIELELEFLVKKIIDLPNSLLIAYGNPFIIGAFSNAPNIIAAYNNSDPTQLFVANIIQHHVYAQGSLPVSINKQITSSASLSSFDLLFNHIDTSTKENIILNDSLKVIDKIATNAIKEGVFPGCQILVARKNKILYHKSFGSYTYDKASQAVNPNSVYDIASLTKIFATTLAIMKLYDNKKINLYAPISKYLPSLLKSNKRKLTIYQALTHQGGLISWIPFYKKTIINGAPNPDIYNTTRSYPYIVPVAENLYMHIAWGDSLMQEIIKSPVTRVKKYLYSDLGFILLAKMVEQITQQNLETYVNQNFYTPLGLAMTNFNAFEKNIPSDIVPTELESTFRKQLLKGYVHDYAAAMLGGIAGNAGLFSNTSELAVLSLMLLNNGTIEGQKFLSKSTVKKFTTTSTTAHRGLGFDKSNKLNHYPSKYVNNAVYGHTGFTGTCFWIDPKNDLIYIFLSNRIHPSSTNTLIQKTRVRQKILDAAYRAIKWIRID